MEKKRIGYLTSTVDSTSGWGRYSEGLIKGMKEFLQVKVVCDSGKTHDYSIQFKQIRFLRLNLFQTFKAYMKISKEFEGIEIVHGLNEMTMGILLLLKVVSRKKIYLTVHGTYAKVNWNSPLTAVTKCLTYLLADGITTGSEYTKNVLPFSSSKKKVRVIANGVNPQEFYPGDFKSKQNYFLFVGALKGRKGVDLLIDAFTKIEEKYSLVIIGDQSNQSFFAHLQQKISTNNMEGRITFLQNISDLELLKFYQDALAVVLPARTTKTSFEGFPMVILEANSCGTPIVISSGFGADDVIVNGTNGFLIPQNDVSELTRRLQMLCSQKTSELMYHSSVATAQKYTWDKIASLLMDFYFDKK